MKSLRLLIGLLTIVAIGFSTRPARLRADASTSKPCGYYYIDGSSWHDFPRDNDCRQNPHAEAQAGVCNIAPHPAGTCSA
jgi:hypothetical protein